MVAFPITVVNEILNLNRGPHKEFAMPPIDLSNPLLWIVILLSIFTLLHFAVTSALGLGLVIVLVKKAKADLHDWAAQLSKWLTGLGFSANITAPLDAVAQGDMPTAIAKGAGLMTYVLNPVNAANEWAGVMRKQYSDPVAGPIVKTVIADLQGGATQQQIANDLAPGITAMRSSAPKLAAVTQAQDLVAHLPSLAGNTTLMNLANLLQQNGQTAAIPALVAGHDVASAAAAAAPVVAKAATVVAAAVPVAAPVAAPIAAAAAGVALSATGLVNGHSITVTAAPGTPAAAAPAPVVAAAPAAPAAPAPAPTTAA